MMKVLARLLVAGVVLAALLTPLTILADQLPLPLQKKINPGVTTISYAGQDLRFTTAVPLVVRLEPLSTTRIKLTVSAYGAPAGGGHAAAPADLNIYWENWDSDVYTGPPPTSDDWEGVLNTESGFTEK